MNIASVATSLVVVALGLAPTPIGATTNEVIKLEIGQHAFWDGEDIDQAAVASSADCGEPYAEDSPCWDYGIEIRKAGAYRLRVALSAILPSFGDVRDWPDFPNAATEMIFGLELYSPPDALHPNGELVGSGSTYEAPCCSAYNVEIFTEQPVAGDWRVRVIPTSVREMSFRMRAKLEGRAANLPSGYLSPNLRITPAFEFNFNTPTASLNPGADTDGAASSCMAEEIEDAREEGNEIPTLCLRYTMGIENAGPGYFVLLADCQIDVTTCGKVDELGRHTILLHQQRFTADGKDSVSEPIGSAGVGKLHRTHGHYHYENIWMSELFLVEDGWTPGDPPPALRLWEPGRKFGFEPTREMMADWDRFYQELPPAPKGGWNELPPGWGDAYEWNRSGNYVDFPQTSEGDPRSGYYVLRGTTDPNDRVIESDEGDNASYALVYVHENGDVDLLERGYGDHPWDADKAVLTTSP